MFGKILSLICVSILVLANCARPKYVEETTSYQAPAGKVESSADCSSVFSESKYCLSWYWENKPTAKHAGSLIFKIYRLNQFDKTAVPVDFKPIPDVVLWMPSMGHGSAPTQTTRLDVGTYRASNVFFIMPGDWDIRFSVKDENDASKTVDGVNVTISI